MYWTNHYLIEEYSTYPINKFILENNIIIFSVKPIHDPIFCKFDTLPHCKVFQAMSGDDIVGFIFEIIGKPLIRYTTINITLTNKKCTINNILNSSINKVYEYDKLSIYTINDATILSILPYILKVDF